MKICYSLLLLACSLFYNRAEAQWDGNSSILNNLVTTSANGASITVTDQYGGAIKCWENNKSIYIQRKTIGGIVGWNSVSSPVTVFQDVAASYVEIADMIPDGHGGVYISWVNHLSATSADLYLQHIASNGQKSWSNDIKINPAANPVCTEGKLCLSGNNVLIIWSTEKTDPVMPSPDSSQLFIRKYDRDGNSAWSAQDVAVSTSPGFKFWPVLASDSSGGAYISFTDTRNSSRAPDGTYDNFDLFAQHISAEGQRLWPANDVSISTQPFHQTSYNDYAPTSIGNRPSMLTDSEGNVIVLYENYVDDMYPDSEFLEAQKISAVGTLLWSNAIKINQQQNNKIYLQSAPDGNNGIVLCWKNVQGAATVYAQRITASGTLPWGINGISINSPSEMDFGLSDISMVKNGDGDYIVTWRMDTTTTSFDPTQYLKAQKFNNAGTLLWAYPGIAISTVDNDLPNIPQITGSFNNSVLFTWKCARGINAALVKSDGSLANEPVINFTAVASGNWDDPSVWAGGVVPVPGANITITQNITVNVNIICNSITVQAPAVLTVNPGISVTLFNN